MKIEVSGHHVEITEDIRTYVTDKVDGLRHFFDGVTGVHVMLLAEKERRIAEVVANVSHGAPVVARVAADGENVYTVVNLAFEKVEAQLRKHKEKIRERRVREPGVEPPTASAPEPPTEDE